MVSQSLLAVLLLVYIYPRRARRMKYIFDSFLKSMLFKAVKLICIVTTTTIIMLPLFGWAETKRSSSGFDPASIARVVHSDLVLRKRRSCTGFRLASNVLLTSSYCLPRSESRLTNFLFDYNKGEYRDRIITKNTRFHRSDEDEIAVVCVAEASATQSILSSQEVKIGDQVEISGYFEPRSHVLQTQVCRVAQKNSSKIVSLDCMLPFGSSGSPVTFLNSDILVGIIIGDSGLEAKVYNLNYEALRNMCIDSK